MIKRIVKLTFQEDKCADFLQLFQELKHLIRQSEGCLSLTLLRDAHAPHVFFTYSTWTHESYLNAYRNSELFKKTWKEVTLLFADKPQAWSTTIVEHLE